MRTVMQVFTIMLAAASLSYSQAQKKTQAVAKRHDLDSAQKLQLLSIGAVNPNLLVEMPPVAVRGGKHKLQKAKPVANATSSIKGSDVSEFQTVPRGSNGGTRDLLLPGNSSTKSRLKNIHGEVYGGLAPGLSGSNPIGAAAGATSKNDKTSIFVQTTHASNQE